MSTPNPESLFLGVMLLVGLWLVLVVVLWRRLIVRHPGIYDSMGRPHFLLPAGLRTLRFIFTRAHRELGDRSLGLTSDAALAVFVLYVAGLAFLVLITRGAG